MKSSHGHGAVMGFNVEGNAPSRPADTPSAAAAGLPRVLGPVIAASIVVGNVIGSGVFKKPQLVADSVPNFGFVALVWVLGGTIALLGSLALAEVAVLYPRAGGNYVFLREAYGRPFGFLWGWVDFGIIRTASIAALATIVMESFHDVLRAVYGVDSHTNLIDFWEERFFTVAVIAGLAWVNIRGVKWGGVLQVIMTAAKIGLLVAIMALPFVLRGPIDASTAPTASVGVPVFTWVGLGTAMLGVQWTYHGWMNIAPIAEEVRCPQRNIPLALLSGVGLVIVVYLGVNGAFSWVIPQPEMRELKHTTVATEYCLRLLGPIGAGIAAGAVMCSAFGTLNGNVLVGPRLLYAMAHDQLAPRKLGRLHPRYQTPAWAIVVVAAWSALLVMGGAALTRVELPVLEIPSGPRLDFNLPPDKPLFDVLTDYAMFGAMVFETLAVATIFVFRRRFPSAERPYCCWGYPVTPIAYVLIMVCVATNTMVAQFTEAAIAACFVGIGALIYGLALRQSPARI